MVLSSVLSIPDQSIDFMDSKPGLLKVDNVKTDFHFFPPFSNCYTHDGRIVEWIFQTRQTCDSEDT